MAYDVTIRGVFYTLLCLIWIKIHPLNADLKITTKSTLIRHDILFFELVSPEEVSYTYKIRPAKDFGTSMNQTFYHIPLVPAMPIHGCSPLSNSPYIRDSIALVERGGCSFLSKTLEAEEAGAVAVIITDHDHHNDQYMIDMIQDDTERVAKIPAFFLLGKDGYMIRSTLERYHMMNAIINIPINISSSTSVHLHQPPWTLW